MHISNNNPMEHKMVDFFLLGIALISVDFTKFFMNIHAPTFNVNTVAGYVAIVSGLTVIYRNTIGYKKEKK